jgi:hypothetical protein
MRVRLAGAVLSLFAIAACAPGGPETADTAAAGADPRAAATTPTDGGMQDMVGMGGMPMTGGMTMTQMQAHMTAMESASGDSVMRMLPLHRQMLANMIAQYNREMAQMNMRGDARWQATLDSLRGDLARMPELSAVEMQRLMPSHHARVMRLMEMHGVMMAGHGAPADTARR